MFIMLKSMKPIVNRYARSKYEFLRSWEAGIQLSGAEVKAVKAGQMQMKSAYVRVDNGELWLENAHISPYQAANQDGYNPERPRKLLMKRQEIDHLLGKTHAEGLTIVPEKVYSKAGLIKVKIALARGLKKYDKRDKLKKRDIDRNIKRELRGKY